MIRIFTSLVFILALTCQSALAEQVDSNVYKSWASHGVGTVVVHDIKATIGPMVVTAVRTSTLKEVTPESVTIEVVEVARMGEREQTQPAQTVVITAKTEKGQEWLAEKLPGVTMTDQPDESVEAAGQAYDAKVIQLTGGDDTSTAQGKLYVTEKVPGAIVKMDLSFAQAGQQGSASILLKSIDAK